MRKFNISVNGKTYEVEVEEIRDGAPVAAPVSRPATPAPKAAPAAKPAPAAKSTAVPTGATTVNAPMPGTIMSVNVNVGDQVNEGDVVCVLEAMKMENEIMAPKAGKVVSVNVSAGTAVNNGDVLVAIE